MFQHLIIKICPLMMADTDFLNYKKWNELITLPVYIKNKVILNALSPHYA